MNTAGRVIIVILAGAAIAAGLAWAQSTASAPKAPGENLSRGFNMVDERGDRVFIGESAPGLNRVADIAERIAGEREDVFAGRSLTSDRTMIEVYATDRAERAIGELRTALGDDFDTFVRIVPVRHSLDELLAAMAEFDTFGADELVAAGPDIHHNGLRIGVPTDEPSAAVSAVIEQLFERGISVRVDTGVELQRTAT